MKTFLCGLPLFFTIANLFGQRSTPAANSSPDTAEAAAAAAGIAGMGFACCFL